MSKTRPILDRSLIDKITAIKPKYITTNGFINMLLEDAYNDRVNKKLNLTNNNTKKIKGRSWMHRFHEKIWIADANVAIVGGANITASYHMVYPNGRLRWRDIDVEMTGRKTIKDLTNRIDDKVKLYSRDFPDPKKMKCFNKYPVGTVKWKNFAKNQSKKYIPFGSGKISKDQDFAMKYVKKLSKGDFNLEGKKWKLRKTVFNNN